MIYYSENKYECKKCKMIVEYRVHEYSIDNYGVSLCRDCQDWVKDRKHIPTNEELQLFLELKDRKVPVELEKYDGHKTIDIAVTDARINIEVDGVQHNVNSHQAIADLERTYYSLKKGYFTLRVPNGAIRSNLDMTANLVTNIINEVKRLKEGR